MSTVQNKFLRWVGAIGAIVVGSMLIIFLTALSHIDVIEENVIHNKEANAAQKELHEKDADLIRNSIRDIRTDQKEIKNDIKEILKTMPK